MAAEMRICRECGGSGETWTCGNEPGDCRETSPCGRCGGCGEARVWTYPTGAERVAAEMRSR